jgi:hypothetical protein
MAIGGIGLGDLIETVADEIRSARDQSARKDAVLALEGCELELKVTVGAEGGGGFKVWFVDLSTKGSAERASTITLRFGSAGKTPAVFQVEQPSGSADAIVPQRTAASGGSTP